jgi:Fe-S cluster biosynthesis and repair protein YggX
MENRMVNCIKYKKLLPALQSQPIPGDLGKKIFDNVSEQAWQEFTEYFKIIINEYRLDLTSPQSDFIFEQKVNEFFFLDNASLPEEFKPPLL